MSLRVLETKQGFAMSPDPEGKFSGLPHQEAPVVITERHQNFFVSFSEGYSLLLSVSSNSRCLGVRFMRENVRMQEVWNESEVCPWWFMTEAGGVNTADHCESSSKCWQVYTTCIACMA